jgi:hypothetical protein
VGVAEFLLTDFCRDVRLPDWWRVRGLGLRPFVVYPPSCRGGRFQTTAVYGGVRLTGAVLSFLGHV